MLQPDNNYFSASKAASTQSAPPRNEVSDNENPQGNSTPTNNQCRLFLAKVIHSIAQGSDSGAHSTSDGEALLNVEQNDVVSIEQLVDGKWLLARSDQQFGRIAIDNCQLLDDQIPAPLCRFLIDNSYFELHVCFASFVAQDVGDLSLTKGDIIVAINRVNEHWMQGQVCFDSQANKWPVLTASQQVGSFPLNHCWQLDSSRVRTFCQNKLDRQQQQLRIPSSQPSTIASNNTSQNFLSRPLSALAPQFSRLPLLGAAHSSSLSSRSSSIHSNEFHSQFNKPPPRPEQHPRQLIQTTNSGKETNFHKPFSTQQPPPPMKSSSLLTLKQHDKLKGWLHTVKKKTARLSTRITASLGLISLTRDEEFERHYDSFKHLEKTIRVFIKNLASFVEHFESFLLALQNTSENLSDFYRDKSHQKELDELRKKNKALACEHFHAFKRTVDRQVITVATQLLQKFSQPHQLISKRSAKLLDYDTKTKEMESCRDLEKKNALRDQYVIAKELYDRINRQLIEELPLFNQLALDIFRDCILVLLESRRNLILSYTKQTASLLETPLMLTYTASDVASSIFMSSDSKLKGSPIKRMNDINDILEQERKDSGQTSGHDTRQSSGNDDYISSRPHSATSQLSSEFEQMTMAVREISSTPLSQVGGFKDKSKAVHLDEPDCRATSSTPNGCAPHQHEDNDKDVSPQKDGSFKSTSDKTPQRQEPKAPELPKQQSTPAPSSRQNDQLDTSSKERRRKKKFQIYVAEWPFVSTGPNQLTIACKQPLKLIKGCDECGNSDWSLVQDKKGQLGYVPTSYIKKKD